MAVQALSRVRPSRRRGGRPETTRSRDGSATRAQTQYGGRRGRRERGSGPARVRKAVAVVGATGRRGDAGSAALSTLGGHRSSSPRSSSTSLPKQKKCHTAQAMRAPGAGRKRPERTARARSTLVDQLRTIGQCRFALPDSRVPAEVRRDQNALDTADPGAASRPSTSDKASAYRSYGTNDAWRPFRQPLRSKPIAQRRVSAPYLIWRTARRGPPDARTARERGLPLGAARSGGRATARRDER